MFFFKQKTAYEMRIIDWSSDVCSSDLRRGAGDCRGAAGELAARRARPVSDRNARVRDRQRIGVPARAAALFGRDWRDDGTGRHGGRGRRLHARLLARHRPAVDRQLRARLPSLRRPRRRRARRARLRQGPVAPVVGRRRRRTNLNLSPIFDRSEEHTSELQSLMRISYAVFCLKKTNTKKIEPYLNKLMCFNRHYQSKSY